MGTICSRKEKQSTNALDFSDMVQVPIVNTLDPCGVLAVLEPEQDPDRQADIILRSAGHLALDTVAKYSHEIL